jgi:hypothetical protein
MFGVGPGSVPPILIAHESVGDGLMRYSWQWAEIVVAR